MENENSINNSEMGQKIFEQALTLWINPEVERRNKNGELSKDFKVYAAQVVMNFDKPNEIRLNEEVRAVLEVTPQRKLKKGESVYAHDIKELRAITLTDIDANAGHFTMMLHNGLWWMYFDFRYNAARSREHLKLAAEFLEIARFALTERWFRPFIDNLYSSTELIAKAELIMHDKVVFESKKHSAVHSRFNQYARFGNVKSEYPELLNRLAELRPAAKYFKHDFTLKVIEARKMIKIVESMLKNLEARIPRIVDTKGKYTRRSILKP